MKPILNESYQLLYQKIQNELQNVPHKQTCPHLPSDLFNHSSFWDYSSEDSKSSWDYCLSMFHSKNEIIPYVYIGMETYALINELFNNDFQLSLLEKERTLKFKDQEAEKKWNVIKGNELKHLQQKISFTRVISVVKNADDENILKSKLKTPKETSLYSAVKTHEFIQLRDLPNGESEEKDQIQQWNEIKFEGIFQVIDSAINEKEPILINCIAGRHRSAAILIAYLIKRIGLNAQESFAYIRTKRACAIHFERSEFSKLLSNGIGL